MKNDYSPLRFSQVIILFSLVIASCASPPPELKDNPSGIVVADGFEIEVIASEPLISDPVDMEIDELGRLFVVEMHGYPLDKSGTGKIKQLIDTDKDGRFDKSIVFAEGFVLPNSIMRWKNGFMVTDAPNVLYLEDTDNDGRADKIDTVLTGFALSNPQHNLSSPLLAMDNWIYLAHEGAVGTETYQKEFGDRGKEIYFPAHPASPRLAVNAGGRSVRFQPDRHLLEMTSSHSQFGQSFDAWGHHLEVGNANHIYQEVINEKYLKRNPDLLLSDATESLSDHGEAAEVFPITENPQHQLLTDVGVITSACGIHAYLGGAFPPPYDHAVFVAEPVSNLVHVDELKDNKTIYTASRIVEHQEFLASKDPKFRPVNIYTGPDGALYIVDFYRQIIEHPEWMGDDVVKSGALYNDSDKGRIYRVTAKGGASANWIKGLELNKAPIDTLVHMLGDDNYWWRLNAQRLILDRRDAGATESISKMITNTDRPYGRLHGLWTLNAFGTLTPEQIMVALTDPVDGIRENAIRIAEEHLNDRRILDKLLSLQDDKSVKVRYQLLCTLGGVSDVRTHAAIEKILLSDIDDNWIQVAALTSDRAIMPRLLSLAIRQSQTTGSPYAGLISKLTAIIARNDNEASVHQLLQQIFSNQRDPWVGAALDGLTESVSEDKLLKLRVSDQQQLIALCLNPDSKNSRAVVNFLRRVNLDPRLITTEISKAARVADNKSATEGERSAAIDLMSLQNPKAHRSLLQEFVNPDEPVTVQLAAIRTMDLIPDTSLSRFLIAKWPALTPELRDAGVRTMLDEDSRIALLLDALETKKISAAEIAWPRKVGLMAQSNLALREKARKIFTSSTDRETIQSYVKTLSLQGESEKGKTLFVDNCSLCHQIRGKDGIALGPDLGTVHNWSKEAIMANILSPNKSISSGFELWSIEMKNGENVQGIIASETPGAITLKNVNGWQKTIGRADIRKLSALTLSIMPEDLSKKIDANQMADLLEYLKKNK